MKNFRTRRTINDASRFWNENMFDVIMPSPQRELGIRQPIQICGHTLNDHRSIDSAFGKWVIYKSVFLFLLKILKITIYEVLVPKPTNCSIS